MRKSERFPIRPRGTEGFGGAMSKPAPFAEKKDAKDAASTRVNIVAELNAGAARDDRPAGQQYKKVMPSVVNCFLFLLR